MLLMAFTHLVTPEEKAPLLRVQPRLLKKAGVLFPTGMHPLVIGNMNIPESLLYRLLRDLSL